MKGGPVRDAHDASKLFSECAGSDLLHSSKALQELAVCSERWNPLLQVNQDGTMKLMTAKWLTPEKALRSGVSRPMATLNAAPTAAHHFADSNIGRQCSAVNGIESNTASSGSSSGSSSAKQSLGTSASAVSDVSGARSSMGSGRSLNRPSTSGGKPQGSGSPPSVCSKNAWPADGHTCRGVPSPQPKSSGGHGNSAAMLVRSAIPTSCSKRLGLSLYGI